MASRPTHNKIAKMIVKELPLKDIDKVNQDVDRKDMLLKYGRYHREHWGHNMDSNAKDSLAITRGNAAKERVRKIHIIVDTNPQIKRSIERMEIRDRLKKMRQ